MHILPKVCPFWKSILISILLWSPYRRRRRMNTVAWAGYAIYSFTYLGEEMSLNNVKKSCVSEEKRPDQSCSSLSDCSDSAIHSLPPVKGQVSIHTHIHITYRYTRMNIHSPFYALWWLIMTVVILLGSSNHVHHLMIENVNNVFAVVLVAPQGSQLKVDGHQKRYFHRTSLYFNMWWYHSIVHCYDFTGNHDVITLWIMQNKDHYMNTIT